MLINKIPLVARKTLIAFCILVIVLEIVDMFRFPYPELYRSTFNRIMVCMYLMFIVTNREKATWVFGLTYFIIGAIDLFAFDVNMRLPRHISSGLPIFDLTYHFRNLFIKEIPRNLLAFLHISYMFAFPTMVLLFLTNSVRKHYGLSPISKIKL